MRFITAILVTLVLPARTLAIEIAPTDGTGALQYVRQLPELALVARQATQSSPYPWLIGAGLLVGGIAWCLSPDQTFQPCALPPSYPPHRFPFFEARPDRLKRTQRLGVYESDFEHVSREEREARLHAFWAQFVPANRASLPWAKSAVRNQHSGQGPFQLAADGFARAKDRGLEEDELKAAFRFLNAHSELIGTDQSPLRDEGAIEDLLAKSQAPNELVNALERWASVVIHDYDTAVGMIEQDDLFGVLDISRRLYDETGMFAEALVNYGQWVRLHPDHDSDKILRENYAHLGQIVHARATSGIAVLVARHPYEPIRPEDEIQRVADEVNRTKPYSSRVPIEIGDLSMHNAHVDHLALRRYLIYALRYFLNSPPVSDDVTGIRIGTWSPSVNDLYRLQVDAAYRHRVRRVVARMDNTFREPTRFIGVQPDWSGIIGVINMSWESEPAQAGPGQVFTLYFNLVPTFWYSLP